MYGDINGNGSGGGNTRRPLTEIGVFKRLIHIL